MKNATRTERLRRLPVNNIVTLDAHKGHVINFDPSVGREIALPTDRLYSLSRSRVFKKSRFHYLAKYLIHDWVIYVEFSETNTAWEENIITEWWRNLKIKES